MHASAVERRPRVVQFFFGLGSRYSYLAATQLPGVTDKTGARFIWRAVHSPELIARAGSDPFDPDARRGQYQADYRSRDARRWAEHYGVPYVEPPWESIDWRRLALACVAAELLDSAEIFARCLFEKCFAAGEPPTSDAELADTAALVGLSWHGLAAQAIADRHDQNVRDALAAGAFGVPSFVTDDGALFWGQDRLPLLCDHLARSSPGSAGRRQGR